mmetsp:Transcript_272/g.685  ORF Transcript_272/g.685 Transcript_272/m.685 type:complete len:306 (-) Transcript_272:34-951(-)
MVIAFTRRFFGLLLTLALTMSVTALETDSDISISFSIWSPPLIDLDFVEDIVSVALRMFLCRDANVILLDSNFRNVCYQRGILGETPIFSDIPKIPMLDFIGQTDPIRSYLVAEAADVVIYDTPHGTAWDVKYEVLQIGSMEMNKTQAETVADELITMEHRIQQRLNASITEGSIHQRLWGTGIVMSQSGQELEAYPESSLTFEEENIYADPALEYKESAIVMRNIGIVMLVLSISFSVTLTYLGKRHRMEKDRKEKVAIRELAEQRGLVTEQGVNLMLDEGRRASELASNAGTDVRIHRDANII